MSPSAMQDEKQEIEVLEQMSGQRLDVLLAEFVGSRSRAQRLIEQGAVEVNGLKASKRERPSTGDRITVEVPQAASNVQFDAGDLEVVYEDEDLLVVDKPAGMVVHPAPGHSEGTLAQLLIGKASGGEEHRAGIVHRLDKETSGLLVVAKHEGAHRLLREMISDHQIEREYSALVIGHPETSEGTIDAPIGRDTKRRTVVSMDSDRPREAITHFAVEETLPDGALLAVRLETGRTHQIRVHLAAIGLPVAGDRTYGKEGAFGLTRQFLHARRLAFDHPLTGDRLIVESPLPDDLKSALVAAREGKITGLTP